MYLSDGSMQLDMPRSIDKSHYDTGGLLLRRQKIVNNRTGRPFQVTDFTLGGCYELYAFRFRVGDVDAFTRAAFEQRGWPMLGLPLDTPQVDPSAAQKNSSFSVLKHTSSTSHLDHNKATALLDVHPVGVPTAGLSNQALRRRMLADLWEKPESNLPGARMPFTDNRHPPPSPPN